VSRLVFPPIRTRFVIVADGLAVLAFSIAGIVSHRSSLPASALAEDALPLLAGWFAAATVFGLYVRCTRRSLLLTWAIGIPLGVLLRAVILGRLDEPRQLAFLATTLILSIVFVLAARALTALAVGYAGR
jgi:hypothetical protein